MWRSSTSGSDVAGDQFATMNEAVLALSDITTFHNYGGLATLEQQIAVLKVLDRPIICPEWMSRTRAVF